MQPLNHGIAQDAQVTLVLQFTLEVILVLQLVMELMLNPK